MFGEYNLHKKNISSIKRNIANPFSEKHLTAKIIIIIIICFYDEIFYIHRPTDEVKEANALNICMQCLEIKYVIFDKLIRIF